LLYNSPVDPLEFKAPDLGTGAGLFAAATIQSNRVPDQSNPLGIRHSSIALAGSTTNSEAQLSAEDAAEQQALISNVNQFLKESPVLKEQVVHERGQESEEEAESDSDSDSSDGHSVEMDGVEQQVKKEKEEGKSVKPDETGA